MPSLLKIYTWCPDCATHHPFDNDCVMQGTTDLPLFAGTDLPPMMTPEPAKPKRSASWATGGFISGSGVLPSSDFAMPGSVVLLHDEGRHIRLGDHFMVGGTAGWSGWRAIRCAGCIFSSHSKLVWVRHPSQTD